MQTRWNIVQDLWGRTPLPGAVDPSHLMGRALASQELSVLYADREESTHEDAPCCRHHVCLDPRVGPPPDARTSRQRSERRFGRPLGPYQLSGVARNRSCRGRRAHQRSGRGRVGYTRHLRGHGHRGGVEEHKPRHDVDGPLH